MDREIKILHTADTHLGYKQYHSEVRRKDFFAAFEVVINDAIDMQVDAVVHAGDLFDSRNPTLEDLLETTNLLSRLKAAGIPFFGIVGNHESKQNTQWLDLLEEMKLAARLGKKPRFIGNVAVYGIDSVPRSKIPLYDYSGFETTESFLIENSRKLLVMHQIVQPFPYAEWDCAEVLEKIPFKVDAVLLGDYHKSEKFKVGDTWITYPGSTERNSISENEPRAYNIITLSDEGLEISKRTIPTRSFLSIPVTLKVDEKPYEQIFSAIEEHFNELPETVVFLEISGDSGPVISFSEIEEYLLKNGALVTVVNDRRTKESFTEESLKVTFSDPDHAVANELKQMNLNDGGLIVDEIVRSPNIPRSRVDEETEGRLTKLIEVIDFKDPDFTIKIPGSENSAIENSESSVVIPEVSVSASETELVFELVAGSESESVSESLSKPVPGKAPEIILEPITEPQSMTVSLPISELASEIASHEEPASSAEISKVTGNAPVKKDKKEELSQEKSSKAPGTAEKTAKKGQKKGRGKPAVPRQYNLGDYL